MTTSAFATLVQIMILKKKSVRKYLDLPDLTAIAAKKNTGMLAQKPMSITDAFTQMRKFKFDHRLGA